MRAPVRVDIGGLSLGNDLPLVLIAGPCQIQSKDHALFMAEAIAIAAAGAGLKFIYKSSFDKANRSSLSSERGLGIHAGLEVLRAVREAFGCPITTDVHDVSQCSAVAEVVELIQIPAFLSRQTDLLLAAGNTGAAVNVKKGQFLSPWDMQHVVSKIESTGNQRILLCDRGTSFGYNTLISDFRGLPIMGETGYPVVYDASHSVQQPGGNGGRSGGQREFIAPLARAAVAVGVAAVFIETHEAPDTAPSDGASMLRLSDLAPLLNDLVRIENALA